MRWPTVVVLDDLHWAGPQTLALLRHLARSGLPRGVLIVGTFRDTGDEVTEPLAACLADLRRVDGAARLRLGGLDADAVERFVAGAAGHALDDRPAATGRGARRPQRRQRLLRRRAVAAPGGLGRGGRGRRRGSSSARWPSPATSPTACARWSPPGSDGCRPPPVASSSWPRRRPAGRPAGARDGRRAAAEVPAGDLAAAVDELVDAGLLTVTLGPRLTLPVRPRPRAGHGRGVGAAGRPEPSAPGRRRGHRDASTRPTVGRCWPSWPGTSPPPPRSAPSTRPCTTAAGRPTQALRSVAYDEAIAHLERRPRARPAVRAAGRGARRARRRPAAPRLLRRSARRLRRAPSAGGRLAASVDVAAEAAIGFETATHFPGCPGGPAVERCAAALDAGRPQPIRRRRPGCGRRSAGRWRISGRTRRGRRDGRVGHRRGPRRRRSREPGRRARGAPDGRSTIPSASSPRRSELADLAARLGDTWSASYASGNQVRALVAARPHRRGGRAPSSGSGSRARPAASRRSGS